MSKPDCYKCKHRMTIPGDCHTRCGHPEALTANLHIKGNEHAIRKGWFCWPFNFDPIWLESCDGFEPVQGGAK